MGCTKGCRPLSLLCPVSVHRTLPLVFLLTYLPALSAQSSSCAYSVPRSCPAASWLRMLSRLPWIHAPSDALYAFPYFTRSQLSPDTEAEQVVRASQK
eukprot:12997675-Heterocapsa_arctica.AAC.1